MAAKKKGKTRRFPADIKKAWQKFEPELAKHKREHERQGETFTSVTREEFEAKMKRVNSPMILSQGWTNPVPPGGRSITLLGLQIPIPLSGLTWPCRCQSATAIRSQVMTNSSLHSMHVFRLTPRLYSL
jgi:hypothetical protein